MEPREKTMRDLLPGLILIVLGALFLADRFFYINFGWYFRTWWPSLLIVIGAIKLVDHPHRPVGALILVGLGVMFQVDRLDVFSWWSMRRMWPVILIVVGVALLVARLQPRPQLPENHS